MSDDGMDVLLGGAPGAKFPTVGTVVKGKVLGQQKRQAKDLATGKLKTWDDGAPIWEVVFTLQTEERDPAIDNDDGTRRLFAGGKMLKAISAAMRQARWSQPLAGGVLAVKYSGDGQSSRVGFSPPKEYVAKYEPPSQADEFDSMAGPDDDYGEEPF